MPVADHSDSLEFSQDNKVRFTTKDYTRGINHLICLGQGELTDRLVIHLYADADGNISRTQFFTGVDERVDVYDYGNAETEAELIKGGTERLESLKDYKEMTMDVEDVAADIGDIVGGREYTTGFLIRREITQKIIKIQRGRIRTQYKVGGKVKESARVGGGSTSGGTADVPIATETTTGIVKGGGNIGIRADGTMYAEEQAVVERITNAKIDEICV